MTCDSPRSARNVDPVVPLWSPAVTHSGSDAVLLGRRRECQVLDDLVADVRTGISAAVVLRGEAGIGKSELLQYLGDRATGCRVVRAAGVQSEMELSYASLHQLCSPLLSGLENLPEPQQGALATAFGLRAGNAPDPFLVGLATLSLLANAADEEPLVCLVDDAQWLDQGSALTLGFVGRRLLAESVALAFAVREPSSGIALTGLRELPVDGLPERAAEQLLDSVFPGRLEHHVRGRILAEARGNPLALLELPRGLTATEMAGGFVGPDKRPLSSQIERGFLRRVQSLPDDVRRVLVIAAADPLGDVLLLRRAAELLGIDADAALSHVDATELITLGTQVRFRHPLVRSAAYRAAALSDRRAAHGALAEATDAASDPDRKAWHRAQAVSGPDEDVAAELERSAARAQTRGGIVAKAAFLERATELTPDPVRRGQRALQAAQGKSHAGAFEAAIDLLAIAETGPSDALVRAGTERLRAEIAFALGRGAEVPGLLLAAATRLEPLDVAAARATHLEAISAAIFAGHLSSEPGWTEVGQAARRAPHAVDPQAPDRLLDALALRLTDGYAASAPMIERVLGELTGEDGSVADSLRWLLLAGIIAADLWDLERWHSVATRHVTITREAGALSALPLALDSCAVTHVFAGELSAASAVIEEVRTVSTAIGTHPPPFGALAQCAVLGREEEGRALIEATINGAGATGQGLGVTVAHYHHAVLCNGLSQFAEAEVAAQEAARHPEQFGAPQWALAELVEAATRTGARHRATAALELLAESTRASGTDWALGVEARSRALLSEGATAENLHREAIEHLGRTPVRVNLARAHLSYGEWLRREGRRTQARDQLEVALEMFTGFGAEGFAERTRSELRASGRTVVTRTSAAQPVLTAQEEQIARLAGQGMTNPEIGTRLFLSPHTVEWHLRKVFSKLDISSRRDIVKVLPATTTA